MDLIFRRCVIGPWKDTCLAGKQIQGIEPSCRIIEEETEQCGQMNREMMPVEYMETVTHLPITNLHLVLIMMMMKILTTSIRIYHCHQDRR